MRSLRVLLLIVFSLSSVCIAADANTAQQLSMLPPAAQSNISAALGRDLPDYQIHNTGNILQAITSNGSLIAQFDPEGIQLRHNNLHWMMTLHAYGYGKAITPVAKAFPQANANRVEYRRGMLTEWYENGPVGLEQGFTLTAPPANRDGKPLTIALVLSGDLTAKLDETHTALILNDHNGKSVLRYSGLTAHDANGKDLHATLQVQGDELLIQTDDADAHYPLTVDPIVQLAELTASSGALGTLFGWSVAMSGDTIVIGAETAANPYPDEGAAYVFVKPESGWANMTQTAVLSPSNPNENLYFGASVAISGNTIVVGAPGDATAYVFVRPVDGWTNMIETAQLTYQTTSDEFGFAVAVTANTVVVGAFLADNDAGAVYIFAEPPSGWQSTSSYTAMLTGGDFEFGRSLAANGNVIVVGDPWETVNGKYAQGAAFVFERPTTGWTTTSNYAAELTSSDGIAGNLFAWSVSIEGGTIGVGSPLVTHPKTLQGAGYVYVEPPTGWATTTQTAELTAPGGGQLGDSISIDGDVVVIGGQDANNYVGGEFIFRKPSTGWVSTRIPAVRLAPPAGFYVFGWAAVISNGTIVVGAPYQNGLGAVFVFGL